MNTINVTQARSQLYKLIDEVASSHEPVQISGKRGNAILISEEDWRSIQEDSPSNVYTWYERVDSPGIGDPGGRM